jgi:phthalate 4,5-dioxygenase
VLSKDENELLTRVGPGTPMGELMREYWIPLLLSTELPDPDGRPMRVRLLGEDLIAFRDTEGRVGLLATNCAHRGASLFFGRNEQSGLRCVYHGWKWDVDGQCVDMPNEPAESNFRDKVRQVAYPCQERNGLIWTYMGHRQDPPPLPDFEWNTRPDNIPFLWRNYRACNWMQALEGDIDSSHAGFLHNGVGRLVMSTVPDVQSPEVLGNTLPIMADGAPRMELLDTEVGVLYTSKRNFDADNEYHRIHPFLFPFHTMVGPGIDENGKMPSFQGRAWVPMDDENTFVFEWQFRPERPFSAEESAEMLHFRNPTGCLPATSEPAGAWKMVANKGNDYLLDYELQRTTLFCGILGNPAQDLAMQEGMGTIYDRTQEHLGTADVMIIRVRQRLIEAARALRERGIVPPGVDRPALYRTRPAGVILPKGANWLAASEDLCRADMSA